MKFLMFPSGLGIFPDEITHRQFHLLNREGIWEKPIAGGYVNTTYANIALSDLFFHGGEGGLLLSEHPVYPDWIERFVASGLSPERKTFEGTVAHAFFLPFEQVERWSADGLGKSSASERIELEHWLHDLCLYHLRSRH